MDQSHHKHSSPEQNPEWEKTVLEKLAFAALDEQRNTRRWGIFFKFLTFAYLIAILMIAMYPQLKTDKHSEQQHVAIIDVLGMIAEGEATNANSIIDGLREAIKDSNTKGIILNINSPGGSAVQAAYVYDEIRRQKAEHPNLPIYSVVGDICASGGYYIASASDKIYVSPASLIGSIGVVMNGFGFSNVLEKLGVERRLMTAGEHKAMLDPFLPVKQQETQHMQNLLDQVHQQFISAVKQGRGDRLKETSDMFSGLIWSGEQSVQLGLADAFGSIDSVTRNDFASVETINFTPQEQLFDRLAEKFGAAFGQSIATALQITSIQ